MKNITLTILWSFGIWSKLERWKSSVSGCLISWLKIKKIIFLKCLLLFYAITMSHFTVHCDIQGKVDFNKTTSDFQLSDWTEKKLQSTYQSQTCTQKSSCSLLGGLLPIWSTKLSEFRADHYIWEVCSANQWNAPKTPVLAASIGQQTNSSAWQCLKIHKTTSSLKVQQIGLGSFASSTMFIWPLTK